MILVVGVKVTLDKHLGQFREVWDGRVISAAEQILRARPGVVSVDFDPTYNDNDVVFDVALDDVTEVGFVPGTTLVSQLVEKENFILAYSESGGWKVQLLTLLFEVTSL